jgi:glycine cleavage system transcriptional repressor
VTSFVIAAAGRDRPGIVAAVTAVLARYGVSVEDAEMAILRGHFTLMLIVAVPPATDVERLRDDLEAVRDELPLESLAMSEVDTLSEGTPAPTHAMSIYGADRVGIVHDITAALAERGVNVIDLTTRVLPDGLYVMLMEVAVPDDVAGGLEEQLSELGTAAGVDVSLRQIDADVL